MKTEIGWKKITSALITFVQALSDSSSSSNQIKSVSNKSTSGVFGLFDKSCPLLQLPSEVQDNITTEFYETDSISMMRRYLEETVINKPERMQKMFNDLYHYAVRVNSHILAWNLMVVLSQIPYMYLGSWADMLAIAATRNPFLDIQEMGVRCFENWEDANSCAFLEQCSFSEKWLQDYANEVCAYIKGKGTTFDVLSQENYSWQMAGGKYDSASNTERYSSGYCSSGV